MHTILTTTIITITRITTSTSRTVTNTSRTVTNTSSISSSIRRTIKASLTPTGRDKAPGIPVRLTVNIIKWTKTTTSRVKSIGMPTSPTTTTTTTIKLTRTTIKLTRIHIVILVLVTTIKCLIWITQTTTIQTTIVSPITAVAIIQIQTPISKIIIIIITNVTSNNHISSNTFTTITTTFRWAIRLTHTRTVTPTSTTIVRPTCRAKV